MSLISQADRTRLQADFAKMTGSVRLLFFTQTFACDTCHQAKQILDELPRLSDRITVEEVNLVLQRERAELYAVDRVPAIALIVPQEDGSERDSHIRFLGVPAGYEFAALVRAIVLVGGGDPTLSKESRAKVAEIDRPVTVRVFSTPTCPHCPRAVTLAHELAWANPNITSFAIDATAYPDLARRYQVTGVPKTIVNEVVEILGAVPEDELVEQTLRGVAANGAAGDSA